MALLDDLKPALRISTGTTAFDSEISDLISAARVDLRLSGVSAEKATDDTDPLIKRAITLYAKSNFGFDNPEAERLQRSYDLLKMHMSLSQEYNGGGDIVLP